jgi:hypothetical protein
MIIPKRNLNQARAYLHPFARAISVSLVSRSGWMRTLALLKTERNTYGDVDPPAHPDRRSDGVGGCPCCAEQAPIRSPAALDPVAAILRSHPKMEGRHLGGADFVLSAVVLMRGILREFSFETGLIRPHGSPLASPISCAPLPLRPFNTICLRPRSVADYSI